ncbi:MAG: bacillithiol biosynthesis BshC, partial [Gammaproteobacteria bacterium]
LADVSGESPLEFVQENYINLSPNVALRPLYQEWILPNVCTVLGSSELNYWLQLKGLFDNYEMPLPSMIVRTSSILVPSKFKDKHFNNDLSEWFENENAIALKHNQELAAEKESQDKK